MTLKFIRNADDRSVLYCVFSDRENPLSNPFTSKFTLGGIEFLSVLQFFQYKKAGAMISIY